jgi:hypothetical protein
MECKTVLEALCQSHEPYPRIRLEIRRRERLSSTVLKFMVSFLCFVIDKAFKNNTACSSATIDS